MDALGAVVRGVCDLVEDDDEACWLQLEDYRLLLIKTIEPSQITPYLRQCQVITSEDEELIFNDPALVIRRRKVGALLDMLQRTGVKGYTAFLESLELDYPQLYRKITGKEPARAFSILVDTAGESGLTHFLMSEVTRLQRALSEERVRRHEALAVAKEQEEWAGQQQLCERELRKQTERVQKAREEQDRVCEELRQLREHNYTLMSNITALSQEKNNALLANRDLQLEVERLRHSLMNAESDSLIQRRRTVSLRSAMEQRPTKESFWMLQRENQLLAARLRQLGGDAQRTVSTQQEDQGRRADEVADEKAEGEEAQKDKEAQEREVWLKKQESQQKELLNTIYNLKRDLHLAEENRDRTQEKREVLKLRCARLKEDVGMYRQRNEETLRQLDEVVAERDKALSSREELHQESVRNLLEKDQYRQQARLLTERSDKLQLQLLRIEGEVLHMKTRLRRTSCSTCLQRSQSSGEESRENFVQGSGEDVLSVTSGENEDEVKGEENPSSVNGARVPSPTKLPGDLPSTAAPWQINECAGRLPKAINFDYRRKRAVRAKATRREHVPCNLDDSTGSDITDSDGI